MSYKNPDAKASDFKAGDYVIYHHFGGIETGQVTSTNEKNVFVRYGAEKQSKATDPRDLTFDK